MFVELPSPPVGPLEPAPLTAWLPADGTPPTERAAFWDDAGSYLLRLTGEAGEPRWFAGIGPAGVRAERARTVREARVLPFRRPGQPAAPTPVVTLRVLRTAAGGPAGAAGTTILAGRAGRSPRWPA